MAIQAFRPSDFPTFRLSDLPTFPPSDLQIFKPSASHDPAGIRFRQCVSIRPSTCSAPSSSEAAHPRSRSRSRSEVSHERLLRQLRLNYLLQPHQRRNEEQGGITTELYLLSYPPCYSTSHAAYHQDNGPSVQGPSQHVLRKQLAYRSRLIRSLAHRPLHDYHCPKAGR
ncbi:unnamed protein product [Zymoseptoria tritici ST99CH_1A5]|uniref:Uncharacterized protein n=1 Tax=Zymoseptoria tritici ST99CH_1A5 TaxID=1276529 RepID=A0A1Y6M487_ZYMTR|nr:unnamed protein product [Zymoseptoria tritici ST99CH_1A5]